MISVLPEPASKMVATAAFTGLRSVGCYGKTSAMGQSGLRSPFGSGS
jgi:hypothetical protein